MTSFKVACAQYHPSAVVEHPEQPLVERKAPGGRPRRFNALGGPARTAPSPQPKQDLRRLLLHAGRRIKSGKPSQARLIAPHLAALLTARRERHQAELAETDVAEEHAAKGATSVSPLATPPFCGVAPAALAILRARAAA